MNNNYTLQQLIGFLLDNTSVEQSDGVAELPETGSETVTQEVQGMLTERSILNIANRPSEAVRHELGQHIQALTILNLLLQAHSRLADQTRE